MKVMDDRFEQLLDIALQKQATDIHFSFDQQGSRIMIRGIDGLREVPSLLDDERLLNYMEYMAHLNISMTDQPQSGSFSRFHIDRFYDFRLAVIRTSRMRNAVLRILNCHDGLKLSELTDSEDTARTFSQWLKRRSGLILFTGLTGSGKTTTIYSLLRTVKGRTIYSLEDPIEVVQDNIVQLEINEKNGLDYDCGIRQILRHNPDIMMIGEIRDRTTARMTVRAALTGCLVISSLHARSVPAAITRMMELGVQKNDLSECLSGIANQRLMKAADGSHYVCIYDIADMPEIERHFHGIKLTDHMDELIANAQLKGLIDAQESF